MKNKKDSTFQRKVIKNGVNNSTKLLQLKFLNDIK